MRVVAGTARGRRLRVPEGDRTRPTSDRVREAVFNALYSLDAIDGARVLDAFAGSGALGIEALSRGAAHCTFVDRDRRALDAVRDNLAAAGLAGRATVRAGDGADAVAARDGFDLVLLDPPYAFDGWPGLLAPLRDAVVVIESDREIGVPTGWETHRVKTYGTTVVVLASAPAASAPDPDDQEKSRP